MSNLEDKKLRLQELLNILKQRVKINEQSLCVEFFQQFYSTIATEDLLAWPFEELLQTSLHFWELIKNRKPDEFKIGCCVPTLKSLLHPYIIIEVMCKDMPFIIDSMRMLATRKGLVVNLMVHMGGINLLRDNNGDLKEVLPKKLVNHTNIDSITEAPVLMKIDGSLDENTLRELQSECLRVLEENNLVVDDWEGIRGKVNETIENLKAYEGSAGIVNESIEFLTWIEDHHFTFLGLQDYVIKNTKNNSQHLEPVKNTGYGILREGINNRINSKFQNSIPILEALKSSSEILFMFKLDELSDIHRDAYLDCIFVKQFSTKGELIGLRFISGLYTSAAYHTNPKHIPFLRHKVAMILQNSQFNPRGHAGKVLLNILETLPRDDLIQGTESELLDLSLGIFYLQERQRIRLFHRMDINKCFLSCLVYVPKDRFNTALRHTMQNILKESFNAKGITFSTYFSESALARIHFLVHLDQEKVIEFDYKEIENKLIEVGRLWTDDFELTVRNNFEISESERIIKRYKSVFPEVYQSNFSPQVAVSDINYMEQLSSINSLGINFYNTNKDPQGTFRLKLYQYGSTIQLSDVIPIIEKLGLRAISERPYLLQFENGDIGWINEFIVTNTLSSELILKSVKNLIEEAFLAVWHGKVENDGFNLLVSSAKLHWREVFILRVYAKYFKQIGFTFSQIYIESALCKHGLIAKNLVALFETRFSLNDVENRNKYTDEIIAVIEKELEKVSNLDEDKIIRQYIATIMETLRTNYYQKDDNGLHLPYLAIKLNSALVPNIPKPYPLYEIFVCSTKFEGIHLRCAKVARGGIRWSDRKEDFRTEIRDLMKAQQVKNAVIVPSGAKGGFVIKESTELLSREDLQDLGIFCYKQFIAGLLDITDNYSNKGDDLRPNDLISYDDFDPYLVVAADKGTATFSDIANSISAEHDFWLQDAFASGGSAGYDHKKIGITAKGAWESVKRNFYELNINILTTEFTVVGIGDMAGDVFGNGMLLSDKIKLVAAFNHMHIFLDPNPDAAASFTERKRLFSLPRSSWDDYDRKYISKGGNVFRRDAKSITLSKEIQELLELSVKELEPNALIQAILRAKVDMIWSGGIGTFVKASTENHADVGDKTNDAIRINASELRCKSVAEGGNLGFTQLARIEYASLYDGLIYTDFIDNSAGVSCSDQEVNIKILLNKMIQNKELTLDARNNLLKDMTKEVETLVIRDNTLQTQAISLLATQSLRNVELHIRYLNDLERHGKIDRVLEYLPSSKAIAEKKLLGKGLSKPEIAVLFSHSKMLLKESLLNSDLLEDEYFYPILIKAFPKKLHSICEKHIGSHPLKREIIATKISNLVVNEMGFSFIYRMQDETGAPVSAIVRSYMITRAILDIENIFGQIDGLQHKITAETWVVWRMLYVRLLRRITRWFLRTQRMRLDITQMVEKYLKPMQILKASMPKVFGELYKGSYSERKNEYLQSGIPDNLAHELAVTRMLFSATDILEVAFNLNISVEQSASMYYQLGEFLDLSWLRAQIIAHDADNHWEALSREALRDDLDWQHKLLTEVMLKLQKEYKTIPEVLQYWAEKHSALLQRWRDLLLGLRSATSGLNYIMFFATIRELLDLTQTSIQNCEP